MKTKSNKHLAKAKKAVAKGKRTLAKAKKAIKDKVSPDNDTKKQNELKNIETALGKKPEEVTAKDIDNMIKEKTDEKENSNGAGGALDGFLGALLNALLKLGHVELQKDDSLDKHIKLLQDIKQDIDKRDSDKLDAVKKDIHRVNTVHSMSSDTAKAQSLLKDVDTKSFDNIRTSVDKISEQMATIGQDGKLTPADAQKLDGMLSEVDRLQTETLSLGGSSDDLTQFYMDMTDDLQQSIYAATGFADSDNRPVASQRLSQMTDNIESSNIADNGMTKVNEMVTQLKSNSTPVFAAFDRLQNPSSTEAQTKAQTEAETDSEGQAQTNGVSQSSDVTPAQQAEQLNAAMDEVSDKLKVSVDQMSLTDINNAIDSIDSVKNGFSAEQKQRMQPLLNSLENLKSSLKNFGGSALDTNRLANQTGDGTTGDGTTGDGNSGDTQTDKLPESTANSAQAVVDATEQFTLQKQAFENDIPDRLPSTFDLNERLSGEDENKVIEAGNIARAYLEVKNKMAAVQEAGLGVVEGIAEGAGQGLANVNSAQMAALSQLRTTLTRLTGLEETSINGLNESDLTGAIEDNFSEGNFSEGNFSEGNLSDDNVAKLSDDLTRYLESEK